jgi:hypothetical protein
MSVAITPNDQDAYTVRIDIKTESLVMVGAANLGAAEEVPISVDDGISAAEPVILNGEQLVLEADNNVQHLRGPGVYYLAKPATAGNVHLFMYVPVRGLVEATPVE